MNIQTIRNQIEYLRQAGEDVSDLIAFAEKWRYVMSKLPNAVETRKGSKYPYKVPAGTKIPKAEKSATPAKKKDSPKSKPSSAKPKAEMIADALKVALEHIKEYHPDATHDDFMEALGRMSGKSAPAKKSESPKTEPVKSTNVADQFKAAYAKLNDGETLDKIGYDGLTKAVNDLFDEVGVDATNFKSLKGEASGIYKTPSSVGVLKKRIVDNLKERLGRFHRGGVIQKQFEDSKDAGKAKSEPKSDVAESEPASKKEPKTIQELIEKSNKEFGLGLSNNENALYSLAGADTKLLDKTYGKLGLNSNEALRYLNDIYNKYKASGGVSEQKIRSAIDGARENINEVVQKATEHGEKQIADFYNTIGQQAVNLVGKHMLEHFTRKPGQSGPIVNPKDISDSNGEPASKPDANSMAFKIAYSPHSDKMSRKLDDVYGDIVKSAHPDMKPDDFKSIMEKAQREGALELHKINEVRNLSDQAKQVMPTIDDGHGGKDYFGYAVVKDRAKLEQVINDHLSKLDKKPDAMIPQDEIDRHVSEYNKLYKNETNPGTSLGGFSFPEEKVAKKINELKKVDLPSLIKIAEGAGLTNILGGSKLENLAESTKKAKKASIIKRLDDRLRATYKSMYSNQQ